MDPHIGVLPGLKAMIDRATVEIHAATVATGSLSAGGRAIPFRVPSIAWTAGHWPLNCHQWPGCPLAKVNHALAMNEKDFMNLIHDVKRHEDAVTEDAKEIRGLKVDVWELSNLVKLLAAFVPRPVSGMVEKKAAIEFETQLHAVLQKHGIER
jgi:hypothetical protein